MADILKMFRNKLIDEVVAAERFLKGTEVDEAQIRDELGKLNLFGLTETSSYAREAISLRLTNENAIETRRLIEGQRRRDAEEQIKNYRHKE